MQRLAHVSLIALASIALPSQAEVFYDAAGRIDFITNVSVTAVRFEWGSIGPGDLITRVFDVDIAFGTFAAVFPGGLGPDWDFDNRDMATAATYGLADALNAGGAPGTAQFEGAPANQSALVPFAVGDFPGVAPCYGCVATRPTTYSTSTGAWIPSPTTPSVPYANAVAWAVFTPVAPPIPEPGTWALMLSGLLAVGFRARRRARR